MHTLLQQLHHWRLGMAEPQPLELPDRAVVNRRYQILCQLGQGSVERTYLAADAFYQNQWCVLKEFVPRLLNPRALAAGRERFEQEVSLLRDLDHPQLPGFREVLECQFGGLNRWIVVQEWLEGMSYHDLVKSRPFTEVEAIAFLQDMLPALNYLHQQEPAVIHGNLSLETILQSTEMGKPILINFGTLKHIALCIADPYAEPVPPRLRLYRPPEQLKGQLNPTADLYALAVTVLGMLTGCADPREFFDRRTQTWCWAEHVAVSVGLVVILDRMLHPDPTQRYQSGGEVQAALVAIHSRLPVPKPQPVFCPVGHPRSLHPVRWS
ncbi:MAG: protein kinase [Synechococcales cyanobacterium CRU_2_2]|nr:protein kinase [Synechococcales cyanobacterium CRU_2_2]